MSDLILKGEWQAIWLSLTKNGEACDFFSLFRKEKKKTNPFFLICVELPWAHFLLAALKPYLTFVQKGTLIHWSSLFPNMLISMLGSNSSVVEIAALPLLNISATNENCDRKKNQWVLNRFFLIVYLKSSLKPSPFAQSNVFHLGKRIKFGS